MPGYDGLTQWVKTEKGPVNIWSDLKVDYYAKSYKKKKLLNLKKREHINEGSVTYQWLHQEDFPDLVGTEVHRVYSGVAY